MENTTSLLGFMFLGQAILGNDGQLCEVTGASLVPNPVNTNSEYTINIDIENQPVTSVLGEMVLGRNILGYGRTES